MNKVISCILCTVLLAMCFSSCSNKGNDEASESIIGVWRLDKVTVPMMGKTYDYAQYSILYTFDTEGILTVFGETGKIEWYGGHLGVYTYAIIEKENEKVLKIGEFSEFSLGITSGKLVISDAPLDGFIYYLTKNN